MHSPQNKESMEEANKGPQLHFNCNGGPQLWFIFFFTYILNFFFHCIFVINFQLISNIEVLRPNILLACIEMRDNFIVKLLYLMFILFI